jgi:hypothetical protein
LCNCRFVKEKPEVQIVDEHGLDDGMFRTSGKTRQGDRLTKVGAVAEFGKEDSGSLHADVDSVAQTLAVCTRI